MATELFRRSGVCRFGTVRLIPILVLFSSWACCASGLDAALAALGIALVLALTAYRMPARLALMSTLTGAAYGLFPIAWIVFASILLYRLAVDTGKFEIIKDSVGGLTNDRRLQALLIAFSFGAFIEGRRLWRPVAVEAAMLPPWVFAVLLRRHLPDGQYGAGGVRLDRDSVTTLAALPGCRCCR